MRRREVLGALAATGLLAVLVAALAFILHAAAGMESAEREARRLAAHEERVRLALWRLDSTLSGFLAYENVRPPGAVANGDRTEEDRDAEPFVARRFEIDPARKPDPSLPSFDALRTELAEVDEALPDLDFATRPAATPTPPAATPAQAADPVAIEAESQRFANTLEFSQRQSLAGQQAQFVPPVPPPSARSETARASPAPGRVRAGLLRPLWLETDGEASLFLLRQVERPGSGSLDRDTEAKDTPGSLEGLEVDLAALRNHLLEETRDLLPAATLEPVLDPSEGDPARRLALLPLRLDPGPPRPLPEAPGWSAGRLGLTAAVVAVALATLSGGLLLLAAYRLARRRSDFASAVIHELRTPLTTFRFYTDMLAEGMVAEEDRQQYAVTLRREADRLGHLVENVLAYARLERRGSAGRSPATKAAAEPVDFGGWLRETLGRLRALAESEGFSFVPPGSWRGDASEGVPEELPETLVLLADPLAAERILFNLCDNSCKYGRGEPARIEVGLKTEGDRATIRWRDHGPGLGRAARRDLFRPFRRGDVGGASGIGLGLSLSRRLARGFGGDLRLVDVEGRGTAFELTLPVGESSNTA